MEVSEWIEKSKKVAGHKRKNRNAQKAFESVIRLLYGSNWRGACHASSAITHILLCELGVDNSLFIGEAKLSNVLFDHSWIEVDGKIIDSAISLPLVSAYWSPPVFLGKDLSTLADSSVQYGSTTTGFDEEAQQVLNSSMGWYMNQFAGHPEGLAGLIKMAGEVIGLRLRVADIKEKYSDLSWCEKT